MIIVFVGLLLLNNYLVSMEKPATPLSEIEQILAAKTKKIIEKSPKLFPNYTQEQLETFHQKLKTAYQQKLLLKCYLQNQFAPGSIRDKNSLVYRIIAFRNKFYDANTYTPKEMRAFLQSKWLAIPARWAALQALEQYFGFPKEITNHIADFMSTPYLHPFNEYTTQDYHVCNGRIHGVQLSPNNTKLAVSFNDKCIHIHSLCSKTSPYLNIVMSFTCAIIHFCDNKKIAYATENNRISIELVASNLRTTWPRNPIESEYPIRGINSLDGNRVVWVNDINLCIYNITEKKNTLLYCGNSSDCIIRYLDVAPDKKYIAAGFSDGTITVWDSNSKEIYKSFNAYNKSDANQIKLRNNYIISSDGCYTIKIFDLDSLLCIQEITENHNITHFDVSSDGNYIATTNPSTEYITIYDRVTKARYMHHTKNQISSIQFAGDKLVYTQNNRVCIKDRNNRFTDLAPTDKLLLEFLDPVSNRS